MHLLAPPKAAILLCLFCGMLSAVFEADEASAHNLAIAGGLLGAKNACGAAERQPTEENIFQVASIDAVALIPQIDNATSDLSSPSLLWSWSAAFPQEASFQIPGSDDCPDGELALYLPTGATLKWAILRYSYGNSSRQQGINASGQNPIQLDLNASHLREIDYAGAFSNLSLNLSGKVSVTYNYKRAWFEKKCTQIGEYVGCGCEEDGEFGFRTYEKDVFDSRNFSVESGPVSELWLNPPLAKRLEGTEMARLAFFARRMPAEISARAGGREIASAKPYSFATGNGRCGEKVVRSAYQPQGNLALRRGEGALFPSQLVEKNAAYLPFYLEFLWEEEAGRKEVVLQYEDWFSHRQNFSTNFSVRAPAAFSAEGNGSAVVVRQGDDERAPAAYPSAEAAAALPDFSLIAALLAAPFLLLLWGAAGWLARQAK